MRELNFLPASYKPNPSRRTAVVKWTAALVVAVCLVAGAVVLHHHIQVPA